MPRAKHCLGPSTFFTVPWVRFLDPRVMIRNLGVVVHLADKEDVLPRGCRRKVRLSQAYQEQPWRVSQASHCQRAMSSPSLAQALGTRCAAILASMPSSPQALGTRHRYTIPINHNPTLVLHLRTMMKVVSPCQTAVVPRCNP